MDIVQAAKSRYSTKVFDPTRKLPQEKVDAVKELIRFSPSSVNSQPWHFILASTEEGKQRIAKAAQENYAIQCCEDLECVTRVGVLCQNGYR